MCAVTRRARNLGQNTRHRSVAWKWYRGFKGAPAVSLLKHSSARMKYSPPSISAEAEPLEAEGQLWDRGGGGSWNQCPMIPRDDCTYIHCDGLFLSLSQPLVAPLLAYGPSSPLLLISLALRLLHDSSEVISPASREVLSDSWFILERERENLIITSSFSLFVCFLKYMGHRSLER